MPERPLTYGSYLKIPQLLALQECRSEPAHHDETLFIVIHQAYELWFKQILHELDTAVVRMGDGNVAEATRLLRRVVEIQRLLVSQVRVLETMRPQDFLGFRHLLNPASGFQSVQFREFEFALGLKRAGILEQLDSSEPALARLRERLEQPSLPDAVDRLLDARGHGPIDSDEARVRALLSIYEGGAASADLVALMEVLIEIDECLSLWRFHHVQMVERMIGSKPGTGGSEGVGYLRTTVPKRAFASLWQLRTHLGPRSEEP